MTLDEYATDIAEQLQKLYNSESDFSDVEKVLRSADVKIQDFNPADRGAYWASVSKRFLGGQLLVRKQGNTALHALMLAIQRALDERKSK